MQRAKSLNTHLKIMLSRLQNRQRDCDIYKALKPENKVLMLMYAL